MGRPYSMDLRERVVAAVEQEGLSRRQAAARYGVGVSTAILLVRRFRETGSVAPGKMGGHRPKKLSGPWREWCSSAPGEGFHLARAGRRAGRARAQGRLSFGVGVRPCREAEHKKRR